MRGYNLTPKELDDLIEKADKNHDDSINYLEFVEIMGDLILKKKK